MTASASARALTCTRLFDMGLTSAESKKLECFNKEANNILISSVKIWYPQCVLESFWYFISCRLSCLHYHQFDILAFK
jgi:hypothetical protein